MDNEPGATHALGRLIRQARLEAGLSQEQLGERVQVAERTVRHYEAGTKTPLLNRLESIARVTGRPVAWFLGGTGGCDPAPEDRAPAIARGGLESAQGTPAPADVPPLAEWPETLLDALLEELRDSPPSQGRWSRNRGAVYCLRVEGDAMSPLLQPEDTVAVCTQSFAEAGQLVVVALPDGPRVVRRLGVSGERLYLEALNPTYPSIPLPRRARIEGRVIGFLRGLG